MKSLHNVHRGLLTLYSSIMVMFFTIAVIMAIIIIYSGFMVSDTQKQVVIKALEKVDDHLLIAGKISGAADVSSNVLIATTIPVRTAFLGSVDIDPQIMDVSFNLEKFQNYTVTYENIYEGTLYNNEFNSIIDAFAEAKQQGLITIDPFVDQQKPVKTSAFVYWVINENFDQQIDSTELAVIAILYAEKDKPTTGEFLHIQANVPEGYILKMDEQIPHISSSFMNFG